MAREKACGIGIEPISDNRRHAFQIILSESSRVSRYPVDRRVEISSGGSAQNTRADSGTKYTLYPDRRNETHSFQGWDRIDHGLPQQGRPNDFIAIHAVGQSAGPGNSSVEVGLPPGLGDACECFLAVRPG